jgi:hypothetical protein
MRTEEEAKYDLDLRIFELYDQGVTVKSISEELGASCEYIQSLFSAIELETA